MSRTSILILLGVLTILAPFSGLPMAIRTLLTVVFGACVFGIGLSMRVREMHNVQQPIETSIPEPTSPPSSVSPI